MKLGDKIFKLRSESGMSASELGKKLNKSESTVRMWESNNSKPDIETLAELSKIFDCSTDFLLSISPHRNEKAGESLNELIVELSSNLAKFDDRNPEQIIRELNVLAIQMTAWRFEMSPNYSAAPLISILQKISDTWDVYVKCLEITHEYDAKAFPLRQERERAAIESGNDNDKFIMTEDESELSDEYLSKFKDCLLKYNALKENTINELRLFFDTVSDALYQESRKWSECEAYFSDAVSGKR